MTTVNQTTLPHKNLVAVVGFDGSPPAERALESAIELMQGRTGRLEVVWVAHASSAASLNADAVVYVNQGFDEQEVKLYQQVASRLSPTGLDWHFQRRDGEVVKELQEVATTIAGGEALSTVVLVVGGSSHLGHRILGSVPAQMVRKHRVHLLVIP
jgi:nucleotide-binding universal stress UspA family protein